MNLGEIKINSLRKICSLILIIAFFQIAFLSYASASSLEDKKREASDIENQIAQIDSELSNIVQEYERTYAQLTEINMAIQANLVKLDTINKELSECKGILSNRVNSIYRCGNMEFISVILGAKDFQDFLLRLDYLRKICEEDARVLEKVERLKKEAEERDSELAENKTRQRVVLNKIDADKDRIEKALKQKKELLSSVKTQIKVLEEEEKRRLEEERKKALASASMDASNGASTDTSIASFALDSSFTFPVAEPFSYCDSWHAPRFNPSYHLHQGCDIFALRGTPALACVNGAILRLSNGESGGIGVTIQDKSGNTYYYGHLDGYALGVYEGMPVSAGQTIGYVGDTGNAKGTPPHVHFEIHPGGGSAINPFPILKLVG